MTLAERLSEYIQACFSGIWVESHEHEDALAEIAQLCCRENWRLAVWDLEQGLQVRGAAGSPGGSDPLAAIRALAGLVPPLPPKVDDDEEQELPSTLLVLVNFHRFLQSAEVVQALARQLAAGKQNRAFIVVLSPLVQIPTELEKQFIVIEHPLPGRMQLEEIAKGMATEVGEMPSGVEKQRLLDAAAGLTRYEAESAFSLSLVRHSKLEVETLWELKSQMLKKSGLLQLHRGSERFDDLGGLEALKAFCKRAMRPRQSGSNVQPKGILLLSPPGCGKSQFSKALGNETGRPTIVLDVGSLLGSLVGQSEANVRQALRIIDAMAPAVCFIDECEKAFSGIASSGQSDSGVSARLFGSFLAWMNDHESDIFVVATANRIEALPPEFSRAERFDGVFFLDLPDAQQRQAIWQIYIGKYGLDAKQPIPADGDWTGAEIKSCCRLAALLDVPLKAAAQNVVPVARTSGESVQKLRQWASGRCLSADQGGIYSSTPATQAGGRRKVSRSPVDPASN
jgi:hypothetical protein